MRSRRWCGLLACTPSDRQVAGPQYPGHTYPSMLSLSKHSRKPKLPSSSPEPLLVDGLYFDAVEGL